jgi:hypothetical protein
MNYSKSLTAVLAAVVCLAVAPSDAAAQHRGGYRGGAVVGRAAPRGVYGGHVYGPRVYAPRIVGYAPYRPYYYPYRPGLTIGFYAGFGYPYGYPYYGYYPYGYGYPYYGYGAYGYSSYGYGPYGYPLPPPGYVSMRPGAAYGGVRIQGAPRDAQVFVDGYYVGVVDDFDGSFKHLNLEAGVHRIELRIAGGQPMQFEVNVQPGQTITYHAGIPQ